MTTPSVLAAIATLATLLTVIACSPRVSASRITAPDGRPGYQISCGRTHAACHDRARRLCPSGYLVHDSAHHSSTHTSDANPAYQQPVTYTTYRGWLLVSCR